MRKTLLIAFLIISNLTFAQKASFKIITEQTEIDDIGAVTLYVDVINNSKKDITILKPATDFNQKWRFYDVKNECDNIPEWQGEQQKMMAYSESDLLVIKAKTKVEIIINGRMNANMLSCKSKTFQIELFYDANELIKNPETRNCNSDELKIIKKLTPIIIKSKKENIVIN
ncbi:hypothetical protein ABF176_002453 [Flavobacterium psychrophilum]|uniref:Uncharacterized protein n=1 Tax=Flavobacterium psychrophilum TaxID=96345 RepID=A0A7U2RAC1_FLAPS|nr:hypothetical protein [Flavobacterium psychrophilum]OAE90482.1 hypothetical protein SU65_12145 [Flavobacterium psychrophilum]OJH13709.1 hypothetical protein FPG87_12920 [Flavobacterium psychrophilum]QRE04863.1 hypothetical protein H0H26_04550 [Flavobacterium psychrophilum]